MLATRRDWMYALVVGTGCLLGGTGCDGGGPKLHPVTVKLQVDGGNVADLTGSTLDVAVDGDPLLRSSGTIEPDGTVQLETLHSGKIRKGVQVGQYRVRIILNDDDRETARKAAKAVAPKFLKFESSGLKLSVPGDREVKLAVAAK